MSVNFTPITTPDKNLQLIQANIQAAFSSLSFSVPSGAILAYGGSTAPSGFVAADGASYPTSLYPALFAAYGYRYGGSGSNFNVPNCQGIFLRGAGSQSLSGITYTGSLGQVQGDQFQGHTHPVSDPGHSHSNPSEYSVVVTPNTGLTNAANPVGSGSSWPNTNSNTTGISVGAASSDGSHGTPRTGTETRPANIGVLYIVKT